MQFVVFVEWYPSLSEMMSPATEAVVLTKEIPHIYDILPIAGDMIYMDDEEEIKAAIEERVFTNHGVIELWTEPFLGELGTSLEALQAIGCTVKEEVLS